MRLIKSDQAALQAIKQEFGKELSELKAKMDQENLQLYRLSGHTADILTKRQDARDDLFYDAVEMLKGIMQLLSQMLGRQDEMAGGGHHHTTGSASAGRPGVLVDATAADGVAPRATESVPPPCTLSPFTTTAITTAPADSSTDSGPASPVVPLLSTTYCLPLGLFPSLLLLPTTWLIPARTVTLLLLALLLFLRPPRSLHCLPSS